MPFARKSGDETKSDLLRDLDEFSSLAPRLRATAESIISALRKAEDFAIPTREVVLRLPPVVLTEDGCWSSQSQAWRELLDGAREVEKRLPTMVNTFNALSSGTTVAATQAIGVAKGYFAPASPEFKVVEAAETNVFRILERFPLADQARASMQRLGLTSPRGGGSYRSPMALLDEAQAALDRPTYGEGGPVSVLISLRGCISLVISELLLRRPAQEKATKDHEKVISLGRQCGQPSLPAGHFDRLGADVDALLSDLSRAKDATMSRQEVSDQFHRGLQVLGALMTSIDETQLKGA